MNGFMDKSLHGEVKMRCPQHRVQSAARVMGIRRAAYLNFFVFVHMGINGFMYLFICCHSNRATAIKS